MQEETLFLSNHHTALFFTSQAKALHCLLALVQLKK